MDRLKIDGTELEDLSARLNRTHDRLDTEEMFNDWVADKVGHAGLAHQLHTFSSAWNARRTHLVEDLYWLQQAVSTINSAFTDVETKLGTAFVPQSPKATKGTVA